MGRVKCVGCAAVVATVAGPETARVRRGRLDEGGDVTGVKVMRTLLRCCDLLFSSLARLRCSSHCCSRAVKMVAFIIYTHNRIKCEHLSVAPALLIPTEYNIKGVQHTDKEHNSDTDPLSCECTALCSGPSDFCDWQELSSPGPTSQSSERYCGVERHLFTDSNNEYIIISGLLK